MDPYLEACGVWSDFHFNFLSVLRRRLNDRLPTGFVARAEERVYIVPDERDIRPDVTIFAVAPNRRGSSPVAVLERPVAPERVVRPTRQVVERFLEIRDTRRKNREVTTVIELLSPTNKQDSGMGRAEYLRKQTAILESATNLIEIDLLRGGVHTVCVPESSARALGPFDYLITRADSGTSDEFLLWRVSLRDSLPTISIPLLPELPDVSIDLQEAFNKCWEASYYEADIDYTTLLVPSPSPEDASWIAEVTSRRM
jgi:hypothetical protein